MTVKAFKLRSPLQSELLDDWTEKIGFLICKTISHKAFHKTENKRLQILANNTVRNKLREKNQKLNSILIEYDFMTERVYDTGEASRFI